MLKLVTLNVSISLFLLSPDPQDTSRSMHPMGVDDCPRITPWNVSCTEVRSARFRLSSMKVFLIMRLRDAPLSTSLGHLVSPDWELDHKGQVSIGQLYLWMIFRPK
jgi:hypothetical protein